MAAQFIRNKVFEPWKKRAIDAGLLPEGVDVKTADSYVQRLYNKQAIAAKRPEFVDRVTDWLAGDQQAKAQSQEKIGLYQGALESHRSTIAKLEGRIAKLSEGRRRDRGAAGRNDPDQQGGEPARQQAAHRYRRGSGHPAAAERARRGGVRDAGAQPRQPAGRPGVGEAVRDRKACTASWPPNIQPATTPCAPRSRKRSRRMGRQVGHRGQGGAQGPRRSREGARGAKAAGTYKGKGERLSSADKAVDRAVNRILGLRSRPVRAPNCKAAPTRSPTGSSVRPTAGCRTTSAWSTAPRHGGSGEAPRGSLAAREFNIPDATIRDFLENDAEHIVAAHLRTMVPDVLLTEKFGDTRPDRDVSARSTTNMRRCRQRPNLTLLGPRWKRTGNSPSRSGRRARSHPRHLCDLAGGCRCAMPRGRPACSRITTC
jgi:hypothetical protein